MNGIKDERIATVDLLRGFALLGILLVNMPGFYSPSIYMDSFEDTHSKIYMAIDILGQGSFYPIFATLFGFGFMNIFQTSFKNNVAFTPLFSRRLFLLLCIGCIHAFVIWYGDILILYAVCGFFLLFFKKQEGEPFFIGEELYLLFQVSLCFFFLSLLRSQKQSQMLLALCSRLLIVL